MASKQHDDLINGRMKELVNRRQGINSWIKINAAEYPQMLEYQFAAFLSYYYEEHPVDYIGFKLFKSQEDLKKWQDEKRGKSIIQKKGNVITIPLNRRFVSDIISGRAQRYKETKICLKPKGNNEFQVYLQSDFKE